MHGYTALYQDRWRSRGCEKPQHLHFEVSEMEQWAEPTAVFVRLITGDKASGVWGRSDSQVSYRGWLRNCTYRCATVGRIRIRPLHARVPRPGLQQLSSNYCT